MIKAYSKLFLSILILLFIAISIFGQSIESVSIENPIDLAYILLTENDDEDGYYNDELQDIGLAYFLIGQEEKATNTFNKMRNDNDKTTSFLIISHWLIKDKLFSKVSLFLSKASETNKRNVYGIDYEDGQEIASKWIQINNESQARQESANYKEFDEKASILNSISEAYLKAKNFRKAFNYLKQSEKQLNNIEPTELSIFTKAKLARNYSLIKKQSESQNLILDIESNYQKIEYSKTYSKKDEIKELLKETYSNLGQINKALNLLKEDYDFQTQKGLIKLIKTYIKVKDFSKAKSALQKVSAFEGSSYEKVQAVELYLEINEDVFALELARSIKVDFRKFYALIAVCNKLIKDGKTLKSLNIIQMIKDIPFKDDKQHVFYDESYSDKEKQFAYIFDSFNDLGRRDLALNIIKESERMDVKANILLAFLNVYKNNISNKTAIDYLDVVNDILSNSKRKATDKILLSSWLELAVKFVEYGKNQKALDIFASILEQLDVNFKSDQTRLLTQIGKAFAKTNLTPDKKMQEGLKKLKANWSEKNNN